MTKWWAILALAAAAVGGGALFCDAQKATPATPRAATAAAASPSPATATPTLRPEVLARYPHDTEAFTQGLLWRNGHLFESTGLYGESSLREVDLRTGTVVRRHDLPADLFGEGLAAVRDHLVQLTWKHGTALVWRTADFSVARQFAYEGEGWGLCFDGEHLVMSDGSDRLVFRDPDSFAVARTVHVTRDGAPVRALNELECVDGAVYANVWQTDEIVRIDPRTGRVEATIDAGGLLDAASRGHADVLNGIAFVPETGHFLITGKLWPWVFEVRWVPRR
ncbi:MAG: glutaminyl-peptide cyclotransferase [Myxococcales bacterium]|nr:glutaminyl-peptide cyclotransferase [Myxococcales bacterium]